MFKNNCTYAQATKRVARQRKIYNNVPPVYILWVK